MAGNRTRLVGATKLHLEYADRHSGTEAIKQLGTGFVRRRKVALGNRGDLEGGIFVRTLALATWDLSVTLGAWVGVTSSPWPKRGAKGPG